MARRATFLDSAAADIVPREGELIHDMNEQATRMRLLADALPEIGLANSAPGWHGYSSVTFNVDKKLNDPSDPEPFQYPDKIAQTVPEFAELAYEPIRLYIQGKGDIAARPWANYYDNKSVDHPAISMMKFWEVHIGHDMPLALQRTNTRPEHRSDYREGVNEILRLTAEEIRDGYLQMRVMGRAGIFLASLGNEMALNRIFGIRDGAWAVNEKLEKSKGSPEAQAAIMEDVDRDVIRAMRFAHVAGNIGLRLFSHGPNGRWQPNSKPA